MDKPKQLRPILCRGMACHARATQRVALILGRFELVVPLGIAALVGTILSGCVQLFSSPTASATIEAASSTPSLTPSATPSPTSTATRTPYPPTPASQTTLNILNSPISQNLNLLFSEDEDCTLPCWYGLRIGESDVDDIQAAFRQVVDLPEDYVLNMGHDYSYRVDYASFYWGGSAPADETPPHLTIWAGFDPYTDILAQLSIITTHPLLLERMTPQHILRELGAPSAIWVSFSPTEVADVASLRVDVLYHEKEQWIELYWQMVIPVQYTLVPRVATWCLNGGVGQDEREFWLSIPPEFDPTVDMRQYSFLPLEVVFGITPEELYERVIQEDNVCLSHQF